MSKQFTLALLAGDGIGVEVMAATEAVMAAMSLPISLIHADIGWDCWQSKGEPIPESTWQILKQVDAALLGAITSKPAREAEQALPQALQGNGVEYVSPIIQLRQRLSLFANIRPCFNIMAAQKSFNFAIIRENTEGLYSGLDFAPAPEALMPLLSHSSRWADISLDDLSVSLRLQSKQALTRIYQYAFQYATKHHHNKVTLADKPNVLRRSGHFARTIFESVAAEYPDIQAEILNVDAVALWIVKRPEQFGVIVAENMFADILSDVAAGVMGGLGVAPSANLGEHFAYFEPVHGSAPNMIPGKANPSAMLLSVAMCLDHLGFEIQATALKQSVIHACQITPTYDLGGQCGLKELTNNVITQLGHYL